MPGVRKGVDRVSYPANRRLQEWEAPELLAHSLVLLYRCITKLGRSPEEKQSIYERICRLDPVQAMACTD